MYEKLGADVGPLTQGLTPRLRTSDGPTSTSLGHVPGIAAARRVRLAADGGGLENR